MKKAFTIIEIIIAIAVLGIGVLGLSYFFAYSVKINRQASNISIASNLAQGEIDEEFAKSYDDLTPGTGSKTRISSDPADPFYNFQRQTNITLIDVNLANSPTDVGLKKIDSFIYWQEGAIEKNVHISTVKTQK